MHDAATIARFLAKVGPPTGPHGCREWQGSRRKAGYGFVAVDGRNRSSHVVAWEIATGEPVPSGMELDHIRCDNPPCCVAEHMRVSTPRENTLRNSGPSAENARKTHCVRGHPLSGDNLHVSPTGKRICRECKRAEGRSDAARARKAQWWRENRGKH